MFTGLVEAKCLIVGFDKKDEGVELDIDLGPLAADCGLGDSIAVNGCCLTVASMDESVFRFHAGRETLELTHLGELAKGEEVNIERSLRFGDQLGGHLVSGHVDGVGRIVDIVAEPSQTIMRFEIPRKLQNQVILKGSVALDGISLTITEHEENRIAVALIPHTMAVTNLGQKAIGDPIHVEADMIGKWIQRQAQPVVDQLKSMTKDLEGKLQDDG